MIFDFLEVRFRDAVIVEGTGFMRVKAGQEVDSIKVELPFLIVRKNKEVIIVPWENIIQGNIIEPIPDFIPKLDGGVVAGKESCDQQIVDNLVKKSSHPKRRPAKRKPKQKIKETENASDTKI
jgi:hypothetical protein